MSRVTPRELRILHSLRSWLPRTQTWVHSQVSMLPAGFRSSVISDFVENLDEFPWQPRRSLADSRLGRITASLPRLVRARLRLPLGLIPATEPRVAILHSHFGDQGWFDLPLAHSLGAAHVVTFYGYDVGQLPQTDPAWRRRYRRLFSRSARILCEGSHMASRIQALGCPPDKVRVQHLGVALDRLPYSPRAWAPGETLRVLIAAAFVEKKGIPYALRALAGVAARTAEQLEVVLVGDARDDQRSLDEKKLVEAALRELPERVRVERHPFLSHAELHAVASRCHLFLSPSVTASDGDSEGGAPVALIEMAASGLVVVSTTHCDIPEVLHSSNASWLAPERDTEALSAILLGLLEHPGAWRTKLDANRLHIEAEYDARRQAERLGKLYLELAPGEASSGDD